MSFRAADQSTLAAMRRGAKIIYQVVFFDGQFLGHADFLRRVDPAVQTRRLPLRGYGHQARAACQTLFFGPDL